LVGKVLRLCLAYEELARGRAETTGLSKKAKGCRLRAKVPSRMMNDGLMDDGQRPTAGAGVCEIRCSLETALRSVMANCRFEIGD